uniref:SCP domain-containing protein n=1 Tax=Meloidogyne javanica TaxID=6303 RepID=A0A915LCE0_MELJA
MCRNLILLFVTVLIIQTEINALTLDEQNAVLACHNNFRASLANGKEQNKTGMLPSGMNIKKLTYSKTVEASATNWANKCTQSHTPSNQRKYGENLAMDGNAKLTTKINALTLDEQNAILDCHNNFRASLANGKEQNKTGMMPQGMNIKKLTYSKTVETSATLWANNCSMSHTPGNQRKYGENLAMNSDPNMATSM